jgi:hypothetical protein
MRRALTVLFAAFVLAALVLPSAASASTWSVKDPSGARMGRVVKTSSRKANVSYRTGTKWGSVQWTGSEGYRAYKYLPGDTGVRKQARIVDMSTTGGAPWWINSEIGGHGGFAQMEGGRWTVRSIADGPGRSVCARVSGGCPGWVAAGAVSILSKRVR